MAKFFESLNEQMIYAVCNWVAVATIVLGPLIGLIAGKVRKLLVHDLLYGVLWGLSGPALALVWALVDARTSYYDYIHRASNPGAERLLWKLVKPYRVDSVYGLGTLALAIIIAGVVLGVLLAFVTSRIDRRFGKPTRAPQKAEGKM